MKKLNLKIKLYLFFLFYLPGAFLLNYATNADLFIAGIIWFFGGIFIHKLHLDDPLAWYIVKKYI